MASSSNVKTSSPREKYPYPTEFNVLDFVPKLSSEENYNDWKLLMRDFIDGQGLIGFIDDKDAVEESNQDDQMARKRSDNLKAAINGDWDKAKVIIQREPDAVWTPITPLFQTALTLAISSASARRNSFVRELLEEMTPYDVKYLVDNKGWTALHHAAARGNREGAEMLVCKNSDLPNVLDNFRRTPLHWAAYGGHRELVIYLMGVTSEDILLKDDDEEDNAGATLLYIALTFLRRKPKLACMKPNPFDVIVEKHYSFRVEIP
ncbi:hypothetical protein C3L33_14467, partial [Rhododendron williamsianum]